MLVTPFPMVMLVSPSQFQNAEPPMLLTLSGMVMLVIKLLRILILNAKLPILVTGRPLCLLGITMSVSVAVPIETAYPSSIRSYFNPSVPFISSPLLLLSLLLSSGPVVSEPGVDPDSVEEPGVFSGDSAGVCSFGSFELSPGSVTHAVNADIQSTSVSNNAISLRFFIFLLLLKLKSAATEAAAQKRKLRLSPNKLTKL